MTAYEDLVKTLREKQECVSQDGWVAPLMDAAADAIETLLDLFPHRCELCVGCELEDKDGRGCDTSFVLSTDATKEKIETAFKMVRRVDNIYCIEVNFSFGFIRMDYVVYFDARKISEEEVKRRMDDWDELSHHPYVAVLPKHVAKNVFGYKEEGCL